jgi:hypothetical protein
MRRLRPARSRCTGCGRTSVLLPAACLPRRLDATETVGAALLEAAEGAGHRRIAARLGLPEGTVRGWLRRARAAARRLSRIAGEFAFSADAEFTPPEPAGSPLADAVAALGTAAAAAVRRLGPAGSVWQQAAVLTGGLGLVAAPGS